VRGPLPIARRAPSTTRLAPEHPAYVAIIAAHEHAMEQGWPGYLDPVTGYFVFTAAEHWARGTCCSSGCRHCPYVAGARQVGGRELEAQAEPGTE